MKLLLCLTFLAFVATVFGGALLGAGGYGLGLTSNVIGGYGVGLGLGSTYGGYGGCVGCGVVSRTIGGYGGLGYGGLGYGRTLIGTGFGRVLY